ncbi:MAG: hypothetical protein M1821_008435 [Bathelium mastoideum]|nr:MAG: hypothetical protein M1821_008435 [Bathelium mastoideum]
MKRFKFPKRSKKTPTPAESISTPAESASTASAATAGIVSNAEHRLDIPSTQALPGSPPVIQSESDNKLLQGATAKAENLGINILHEPADAVVDIVFVHGLTGNAFDTWFEKSSKKHWPTDFVKQDLPAARLLAFGYRADVANFWGPASQAGLSAHASNLVGHLVGLREDTDSEERRIVFVVHSLGGLVVERALQVSESNAEPYLCQIERCTHGILFLGTPHKGSDLAPFAASVARATGHLRNRVNHQILDMLKRESQMLADLDEWFYQWLRRRKEQTSNNVHVTCFWEELELPVVGRVVTEESATIRGYPHYSIAANHMDITKFASKADAGYTSIRRELRRWIKPLLSSQPPRDDSQLGSDVQEFLRSLDFDGCDSWQTRTAGPFQGTFQWIIPDSGEVRDVQAEAALGFRQWLLDGQSIFWICGNPGTGKSTLMKHLADSEKVKSFAQQASQNVEVVPVVYFFYQDHHNDLVRSIEGLLRSLLYQIIEQKHNLYELIDDIWKRIQNRSFGQTLELEQELRIANTRHQTWTTFALTEALKKIAQQSTSKGVRFLVFVDGLDEYEGKDVHLAEFFTKLAKTSRGSLQMCLASRNHPEFKAEFELFPHFQMEKVNADDLTLYIEERLRNIVVSGGADYQVLPGMVIANCRGVFLRAREVCELVVSQAKLSASLDVLKKEIQIGSNLSERDCSARLCQHILDRLDLGVADEAILILVLVLQTVGEPLSIYDLAIIVDNLKDRPSLLHALTQSFVEEDSNSLPSTSTDDEVSVRSLSNSPTARHSRTSSNASLDLDGESMTRASKDSNPLLAEDEVVFSTKGTRHSGKESVKTDVENARSTFPRLVKDAHRLQGRIDAICGGLLSVTEDETVVPLYDSMHSQFELSMVTLGPRKYSTLYHGDQQLLKASLRSLFTIDPAGVDSDVWEDVADWADIADLKFLDYAVQQSHHHWHIAEKQLKESQFKLFREVLDGDIADLSFDVWQNFIFKRSKFDPFFQMFPPQNFLEYTASSNLPHSFKEVMNLYDLGTPGPGTSPSEQSFHLEKYDVNSGGGRLLYCAARGGNKEILDIVLHLGARIHTDLVWANAALGCCIYRGHLSLAQRLLLSGADVNQPVILTEDVEDMLPTMTRSWLDTMLPSLSYLGTHSGCFTPLVIADIGVALRTVKALLQRADPNLPTLDEYPLWVAASRYKGAARMAKLLLKYRADPNLKTRGKTMLETILNGSLDKKNCRKLVLVLLEYGALVSDEALAGARGRRDKLLIKQLQEAYSRQAVGNDGALLSVPARAAVERAVGLSSSEMSDSD